MKRKKKTPENLLQYADLWVRCPYCKKMIPYARNGINNGYYCKKCKKWYETDEWGSSLIEYTVDEWWENA